MGIAFSVFENGEPVISLSEYSIKKFNFLSDTDVSLNPKQNDITREVAINGDINPEKISRAPRLVKSYTDIDGKVVECDKPQYELREIDSVRKLANWAIIPEYEDCCRDANVTIKDAAGRTVKTEKYIDLFVVDYAENFDDSKGRGTFRILMRERTSH